MGFKGICILFTVAVTLGSCWFHDSPRVESKQLVGEVYIVDLHLDEHPGYYLISRKEDQDIQLLNPDDQVDYVKWDNYGMVVKTLPTPNVKYYFIRHDAGMRIIKTDTVDEGLFKEYENLFKTGNYFNAKSRHN